MFKEKSKVLVIFAIILLASICYFSGVFAKTSEDAGWKVRITSNGTKDLIESTEEVTFEVKNNPNIVKGKIAPGTTAIAAIDVDLEGTEWPVEISASIDEKDLKNSCFELKTKVDGKEVLADETLIINPENGRVFTNNDGKKVITFELKWIETELDSEFGIIGESFELPIKVKVEQHI